MKVKMHKNVYYQSYGEHLVTGKSDSVRRKRDTEIAKARVILQKMDAVMKRKTAETEQYEALRRNNVSRRVRRQQSEEA